MTYRACLVYMAYMAYMANRANRAYMTYKAYIRGQKRSLVARAPRRTM